MYRIYLRKIYAYMEHPLAQGSRLVDGRVPRDEGVQQAEIAAITVLGDRLPFYGSALQLADEETSNQPHWSLHVWNWHEGGDQLCVGVSFCLPFRDLNSDFKRTYVYSANATFYSRSIVLPRRSF
jgi:hypothetical protein